MQTTTTTLIPTRRGRFVDPDALICPGCAERVRCAPPRVLGGPRRVAGAAVSHHDATALCRTGAGVVADPIEAA